MDHDLSGILVVDKPANITSATVVSNVKRLLKAKKVGHTGTLDPFATGVLICCINKATRLAGFLLKDHKKYVGILHLGVSTDTQDSTGAIVSTSKNVNFSVETLQNAVKQFEGSIEQEPPVYSALKFKGVPLHKLARAGKPVRKPARRLYISYINILDINLPEIRFETSCSAGTYVRTLGADIGEFLGCGGHLKELRRIESSGFSLNEAVPLSELKAMALSGTIFEQVISMKNALRGIPEFAVTSDWVKKIKNGVLLKKMALSPKVIRETEGLIKIIDEHGNLIAVLNNVNRLDHYRYCCVFAS